MLFITYCPSTTKSVKPAGPGNATAATNSNWQPMTAKPKLQKAYHAQGWLLFTSLMDASRNEDERQKHIELNEHIYTDRASKLALANKTTGNKNGQ